jgi:hypothetical protein
MVPPTTGNLADLDPAVTPTVGPITVTAADLSAWCESLRGRFVVEVGIGDGTRTRTFWYSNVRAAERCVDRAHARGQVARVALVKTLPVGMIAGLGGAR